jgi:hypothetical protein
MVSRILFWGGFGTISFRTSFAYWPPTNVAPTGVAVRFWQLGLEMRPFFNRGSLWAYPIFAGVGGSFGYWLQGVDDRQSAMLEDRKASILEKRAKRAAREATTISAQHA